MSYMPLTELDKCWMHNFVGLFCHPEEWCAAGAIGGEVTLIGHLRPPTDGEPMIVRFMVDTSHGSGMYAVLQLAPNLYRCLLSSDLIVWDDDRVKVYSALSRILGGLRLDLNTFEAFIDNGD